MTTTMFDSLPSALIALFLALCVLWLIWQMFRRLLSPVKRRREPFRDAESHPGLETPTAQPAAATVSTIPDAADVLALKAAIDNLARQVAALERRLASGQPGVPPRPVPGDRTVEQRSTIPSVTPDHRI
jgi:hypothetical protein